MKSLMMLCSLMMACGLTVQNAKVPAGYRTCSSDVGCQDGEYCGFVEVDSVAVCRPDNNFYSPVPHR